MTSEKVRCTAITCVGDIVDPPNRKYGWESGYAWKNGILTRAPHTLKSTFLAHTLSVRQSLGTGSRFATAQNGLSHDSLARPGGFGPLFFPANAKLLREDVHAEGFGRAWREFVPCGRFRRSRAGPVTVA